MLPVAAVAFVALLVSDLLRTKPIYGELLERYVRAQGMQMAIASHVGSGIMELPLEMGAIADGKRVCDVRWPSASRRKRDRAARRYTAACRRLSGGAVQWRGGARGATCDAAAV